MFLANQKPKVTVLPQSVRLPNGEIIAGFLVIVEYLGQRRTRFVVSKNQPQEIFAKTPITLASGIQNNTLVTVQKKLGITNFFSWKDFTFFTSQQTRAPAF